MGAETSWICVTEATNIHSCAGTVCEPRQCDTVKLHFLYSNSHWQVSYVVESHDYQYENIYLRVFLCLSMPNCGIGNEAHKCVPRATMIEIYKTESDVRTAL